MAANRRDEYGNLDISFWERVMQLVLIGLYLRFKKVFHGFSVTMVFCSFYGIKCGKVTDRGIFFSLGGILSTGQNMMRQYFLRSPLAPIGESARRELASVSWPRGGLPSGNQRAREAWSWRFYPVHKNFAPKMSLFLFTAY